MPMSSPQLDLSWRSNFASENRPVLEEALETAIAKFKQDFETPGPYTKPPTEAEFQAGLALAHQVQAALQDAQTDPNGIAQLYRQCLEHRRDYSLLGASLFETVSQWHWLVNQEPQFTGSAFDSPIRISPWLSPLGRGAASVAQTLAEPCEGESTFQRRVPGSWHYARVQLKLEPLPVKQSSQIIFQWKVQPDNFPPNDTRDSIPLKFIPHILNTINTQLMKQAQSGTLLSGLKITVQEGSYHPADSKEFSYEMATMLAFNEALETAQQQPIAPIAQGWWAKLIASLGELFARFKSMLRGGTTAGH